MGKKLCQTAKGRREKKNAKIIAKYDPNKIISKGKQRSFNIGYLFLQSIYHELKINKICKEITKRYEFSFDLHTILSRLIYMRVLTPRSKKETFESAHDLLEPHHVKPQHIYRALDVLADESDYIEEMVHKNRLDVVERNTSVIYYDCTNFYFEIIEGEGLKQYVRCKE